MNLLAWNTTIVSSGIGSAACTMQMLRYCPRKSDRIDKNWLWEPVLLLSRQADWQEALLLKGRTGCDLPCHLIVRWHPRSLPNDISISPDLRCTHIAVLRASLDSASFRKSRASVPSAHGHVQGATTLAAKTVTTHRKQVTSTLVTERHRRKEQQPSFRKHEKRTLGGGEMGQGADCEV